jgi:hypothetical protein
MDDVGPTGSLAPHRASTITAKAILPALRKSLPEHPVEGKTYSLYGEWETTDEYYRRVGEFADRCQARWGTPEDLLTHIRRATRRRRLLRSPKQAGSDPFLHDVLPLARELLSAFTAAAPGHVATLGLRERWDRTLSTPRDAYHLLMLEIELTNRVHREAFRRADIRLAFLPHCLRDWSRDCRSSVEGLDYICRGCSKNCWVNGVSKLLRFNEVTPHIWMTADLPSLFKRLSRGGESIGILGVACIPELSRGMRLCRRHHVAVTGVPLNANRCARWTGRFQPTSVNLDQMALYAVRGGDL